MARRNRGHHVGSRARLLLDATVRRVAQPRTVLRSAIGAVRQPRAALHRVTEAAGGLADLLAPAFDPVSATPMNVEVGPHRRFDWLEMRVADLKAVKNVLGGTLNDVVLVTVSGALRRFLRQRGVDPDALKIRAMVPVSVRTRDEHGTLGNRVTQINDPTRPARFRPCARGVVRGAGTRGGHGADIRRRRAGAGAGVGLR